MSQKTIKKGQKKAIRRIANDQFIRWSLLTLLLTLFVSGFYYQRNNVALPAPPQDAPYRLASTPIDVRVDDLLSRMTLQEKLGQMAMVDKNSVKKVTDVSHYNIGAVLSGAGAKPADNTPAGWLAMVESLKAEAKKSRLGIPLLYGVDATHGHANVPGATVFPHEIGLGATHNPDLVRSIGLATGEELAATGINWNFAPSLDAPEDIRWGRTYEAFSSDPALNARLGAAYIAGNQMFTLGTAKHFLAAGSMQWQSSSNKNFKIDQGTTLQNEKLLDYEYLVPFAAASRADVASVMVGLNHWGNHRVIDDPHLITDKLKKEIGFAGFVVSDWYGVYEFSDKPKYQANVDTINAGLDMAMLPFDYKTFIKDTSKAVKKGDITESRINDAVRRILYQKFKAGLFDDTNPKASVDAIGSAAHRSLARRAVAESAVLLKNNDNLLPLSKAAGHILVAGSGANNIGRQCGAWTVEWQGIDGNWLPGATSILQGIRTSVGTASRIDYDKDANFQDQATLADVGIVVVSEKPYAEGWGDNAKPTLDPSDIAAITRMKTQARKVVVVTVTGRPLLMNDQIAASDAVVAAWLPGSEGEGVADILFGDQPFKGTLPVAWPATQTQLPIKTNGATADNTPPLFLRSFGI